MNISIIIPTLNEADNIREILPYLQSLPAPEGRRVEILVADGKSTDGTLEVARAHDVRALPCPRRGRASQMNFGAKRAAGDLLFFVHADTRPPRSCLKDITEAVEAGYPMGCFRFRFDHDGWLFRINDFFTRFDLPWCRGGDQAIFITRAIFEQEGGYPEDWMIMEEYDLMRRVRAKHPFRIIPKRVIVSARKYRENGWLRVQWANFVVFRKFRQGAGQRELCDTYRRLLKHRS